MQPLSGIRVLDFTTLLPGPLATLMLAEAGAEVIKIERAEGEDMRRFSPVVGGQSAPFAALNGGKQSVSADLKNADDIARLKVLIAEVDIVIEQFRPGVIERLGLGYDDARKLNPRLIYCSISGFGQTGPRSGEAGHDINYQALGGLLSLSPGTPDAPNVSPALTCDIAGGALPAVINILLALRQRDVTGEGCRLDIAMTDAAFTFAVLALSGAHGSKRNPGAHEAMLAGGDPRYQLYATSDDRFLAVGALEAKFWQTFCDAIALPAELRDFARHPEKTRDAIAAIIRAQASDHWRRAIEPLDCCATVVRTLDEALADPHFRARGLFDYEASLGGGAVMQTVLPVAPQFRRPASERRKVEKMKKLSVIRDTVNI
ncbi:CaiB/BaiF CoA-transferase family protein [Terrarubrum flagellatum]|uniref:CaiB/BaiF CoA transferase family protein n=1 Tax=Terrirubrum flagellatum TaxID=2895980 RepID=UPI0031454E0C